ncbi:hypothetical protein [Nocardia sp. NBC_00403]|uniref:hypothetical protein n=1 Tax=Nocardia sp. NBC_00403 TaxID=2975990 RepID=UPI002E1B313E
MSVRSAETPGQCNPLAREIQIATPVRIGHLDTDDANRYSSYGLVEVLRMLPDYMDLTGSRQPKL